MKIHCGDQVLETNCTGCPCHWNSAIQMGELVNGRYSECGCPKTVKAFKKMLEEKSQ